MVVMHVRRDKIMQARGGKCEVLSNALFPNTEDNDA